MSNEFDIDDNVKVGYLKSSINNAKEIIRVQLQNKLGLSPSEFDGYHRRKKFICLPHPYRNLVVRWYYDGSCKLYLRVNYLKTLLLLGTDEDLEKAKESYIYLGEQAKEGKDIRSLAKQLRRKNGFSIQMLFRAYADRRVMKRKNKGRNTDEVERDNAIFERHCGYIEHFSINEITESIIDEWIDEIQTDVKANSNNRNTGEETARICFRILRAIAKYAVKHFGMYNPHIMLNEPFDVFGKRDRKGYTAIEPRQVNEFMGEIVQVNALYTRPLGLDFMLLTGLRPGLTSRLTFDHVNFDKKQLEFSKEEMKNGKAFVVPLSRQAMRIIELIKTIGHAQHYIFCKKDATKPLSAGCFAQLINRTDFKELMCGHGSRTVFATAMGDEEQSLELIAMCLSHSNSPADKSLTVTKSYERSHHITGRRLILDKWGSMYEELVEPENSP
ncbi:MAG: tyrosine-type recombinase/integrase, partial [Cellvibrionales bacterium]|nr:tyrosine-type recombinase/integrase [Cellvibrionales bacterium]